MKIKNSESEIKNFAQSVIGGIYYGTLLYHVR